MSHKSKPPAVEESVAVNVVPLVCLDNLCPAIVGRVITFHDDDHITITWARAVAREFGGRLGVP